MYTVSVIYHNYFYMIILVLFVLYIVLTQFICFVDSGIYASCIGKGFYYHKIHETTKIHVFWHGIEKQKYSF